MGDDLLNKLTEISDNLTNEKMLKLLQSLINDEGTAKKLYTSPQYSELLNSIQERFKSHEKKAALYAKIQGLKNSKTPIQTCKSIHDCDGTFVWADENCMQIFGLSESKLMQESLFSCMLPSSRVYLEKRFNGEIFLGNSASRVFSYLLWDGKTALTSRLTPVITSNGEGDNSLSVLVQTRYARHPIAVVRKEEPVPLVEKRPWDKGIEIPSTLSPFVTEIKKDSDVPINPTISITDILNFGEPKSKQLPKKQIQPFDE